MHKNLPAVLKAAHGHRGASFVEIFQNCIVYNDEVFASFTDKKNAPTSQIWLEEGAPMLFAGGTKGLALDRAALRLEVVDVIEGDWRGAGVILHDQTNKGVAQMLIDMEIESDFPVALGVIYNHPRPTFERAVVAQNEAAAEGKMPDLQKLVAKGQTWMVEKEPRAV